MNDFQIDQKEVYRYLGYGQAQVDDSTVGLVQACLDQIQDAKIIPRHITKRFDLRKDPYGYPLIEGITLKSDTLGKHLLHCDSVYLLAATLGLSADRLLQRESRKDISSAVILQAVFATMIESYSDRVEADLAKLCRSEGLFLRPRYSPGYGDFPLTYQRELLGLLNATKKIGLSYTDSFMLVPTKSVTAVIGLTKEEQGCHIEKCRVCSATNCSFRKI